jgi:serine/threonine protein phosphatase 1
VESRSALGFVEAIASSLRTGEGRTVVPDNRTFDPILSCDGKQATTVHYGVGDIHGMRGLLDNLIGLIEADAHASGERAVVVFLGDLVNRGPSSRQVLERLIEGPRRDGDRWITLRGNHDQMMLDAVAGKSEAAFRQWMQKGGMKTLASYGVGRKEASLSRARRAIPSGHLSFLNGLPFYYRAGNHIFVHAGIDPRRPLDRQSETRMMTIREPFLRESHLLPFTVVHGHVPSPEGPVVAARRICVDTGAYASGVLTAVALRTDQKPCFIGTSRELTRAKR